MQLKPGVKLGLLRPQMVLAAIIVEGVYLRHSTQCVITSANDSTHSANSLHYSGRALDFRTKTLVGNKELFLEEVKAILGSDFDVILESLGTDNEHLHVEYDPK